MAEIHPTAIIEPQVKIAADVEIGPYCVITGDVTLGKGCRLGPHSLVQGTTRLGSANILYGHCSIGADTQDKKYRGGGSLRIGSGNTFREFCTVNRATESDGETVLGDNNLLMAYSHVGHECEIGSDCVLANAVQLGGHVSIADRVILGGAVLIHQHCRIGKLAIVGGDTGVRQDVPPFASFTISHGKVTLSINKIGLERAGMRDDYAAIAKGYKLLYHQGLRLEQATEQLRKQASELQILQELVEFVEQKSMFGLARPRHYQTGELTS